MPATGVPGGVGAAGDGEGGGKGMRPNEEPIPLQIYIRTTPIMGAAIRGQVMPEETLTIVVEGTREQICALDEVVTDCLRQYGIIFRGRPPC